MNGDTHPDRALLDAWATRRDRRAAGDLVGRYFNLVHGVARRKVHGDEHLADDITQAVFILLLNKAHKIHSEGALVSWLYTTTGYAAANALKMLRRRKYHEGQHTMPPQSFEAIPPDVAAERSDLAPLLHQAIDQLTKTDRLCIVMSYLQQKTNEEIAAVMGLSPAAARKRISRAVERMREFLASRGVVASAVAIPAALAIKQAPLSPALVESTLNIAIVSQSAGATGASGIIAKAVSNMMIATKIKIAASIILMLLFTGLVTGQAIKKLDGPGTQSPAVAQTPSLLAPGVSGDVADNGTVDLHDGVVVQFVGVAPFDGTQWIDINGWPIDPPEEAGNPQGNMGLASRPTHRALIRVKAPNDVDIAVSASGRGGWRTESNGDSIGPRIYQVPLIPDPGANSINLDVWIADGPWTTLTTMAPHQGGNVVFSAMSVGSFEVTMTPMIDQNGKAQIFISTTKTEGPKRVSAIGNDGKAYAGRSMGWAKTTALETQGFTFDLAAARIKSVMIQERDYNWHIVAQNVTLDASHPTAAKILVNPK